MSKRTRAGAVIEGQLNDEELEALEYEGWTKIDDILIPPAIEPVCSLEAGAPRLIIEKITNKGFKSFAETTVVGPFEKCFTSIIGPNGSGKSNCIDSMLFVFGCRANKIRSKKLPSLIHGSGKNGKKTSATVTVHFVVIKDLDNNNYEEIPDSRFDVSRTVWKDGRSEYRIKNRTANFKEVGQLLKSHGIDLLHSRFLILQGEVEQIAMMNPIGVREGECGMLEYLEDIIGTERYRKPLMQINERVDDLREVIVNNSARVQRCLEELEALEGPRQEALLFLKMENQLIEKRSCLFQKQIYDFQQTKEETEDNLARKTEILNEKRAAVAELKEHIKEREKFVAENKKVFTDLNKQKDKLQRKLNETNSTDEAFRCDIETNAQRRKKLKTELESERKKLNELKATPERHAQEVKRLETKRDELTREKDELIEMKEKVQADLQAKTAPLLAEKSKIDQQLMPLKQKESEIAMKLKMLEENLASAEQIGVNMEEKKQLLLKEQIEIKSKLKEIEPKINALKREHETHQTQTKLLENQLQAVITDRVRAQEKYSSLVNEVEKRRSKNGPESSNRVSRAVQNLKRSGKAPGVYGRLGDLGAIDAKYDVAISTACSALDNVVADNTSTVKTAIEYFRSCKAGRVNFMALDKQEHLRATANSRISTPENVHRLFDLVKTTDNRLRTAFYYALRDTLVANDIQQARRVAYGEKRFRVVTLAGETIELSGTMTGGGRKKISGRMGQRVSVDTSGEDEAFLRENEPKVAALRGQVEELNQKYNKVREELETSQMEFNSIRDKFGVESQMFNSLKQRLTNIQKELEQLTATNAKVDESELKKLRGSIATTQKALEDMRMKMKDLTIKAEKIDDKITKLGGDQLTSITARVEAATKQLNATIKKIAKMTADGKDSASEIKRLETRLENIAKDIAQRETTMRELAAKRKEIETEAAAILQEFRAVESEINDFNVDFDGIAADIESSQKKRQKVNDAVEELHAETETMKHTIQKITRTVEDIKQKHSRLKLTEVEGQSSELKKYTPSELESMSTETISAKVSELEEDLERCTGNKHILEEYDEKFKRATKCQQELNDVKTKRDHLRQLHDKLAKDRSLEFRKAFHIINMKLKELYQMITFGGDAELEFVDSLDPFTDGINFSVRPPEKTWKNISNLSGGEKTLSSLSLVFALHYYKPSPIFFLDEIDAALDFRNVSIIANFIKERTKNAQFIIISLREQMFELADRLVGIFKTNDSTKTVVVNPHTTLEASRSNDPAPPEPMDTD